MNDKVGRMAMDNGKEAHRSLNTSLIYAKVDHGALAGVALPWPGSAQ